MSILDIFKKKEQRSKASDFFQGLSPIGHNETTIDNSLRLSAVQACVKVLSEDIASLPLFVYKSTKQGKEKAEDHSLYNKLHLQPNPWMDSFTFFQTAMVHLLLWGNCYVELLYKRGQVDGMFLLPPAMVEKILVKNNYWYKVKFDNTERYLRDDYVMHILYMTRDGVTGISPIEEASDMFDVSYSAQTFAKKFYQNGMNTGGVLQHPGVLNTPAQEKLQESLKRYRGLENSHRTLILEEGMTYTASAIPPNHAQMLETRRFQIEEIARIYRIPLHLIQSLDHATNNNIEHQSLDYVMHTLRPWLVRWERAIKLKLFNDTEYFAEFNINGLLRGDYKTRMEGYSIARQNGFMTVNEIRTLENMNTVPEGDTFLQPLNMVEVGKEQESEQKSTQIAEKRSDIETRDQIRRKNAQNRHDITLSYKNVMKNAFEAIAKREKADIMRKLEKIKDKPVETVTDYIWRFYETHTDYIMDKMLPVTEALAGILEKSAAEEVNSAPNAVDAQQMARDFVTAYAEKYIGRHRSQLLKLINENRSDEEPEYIGEMAERIDEWVEKQPEKSSLETVVQLAGFIVSTTFFKRGHKIVWVNTGSDTCEYCQNLDGMVVGRDQPFVGDGVLILDMLVNGAKTHPPLHRGCVCQIGPE